MVGTELNLDREGGAGYSCYIRGRRREAEQRGRITLGHVTRLPANSNPVHGHVSFDLRPVRESGSHDTISAAVETVGLYVFGRGVMVRIYVYCLEGG
tara:strand:- start:71 stop:361 length:291 start_codon:yes stop_codon:yes gene_type:complete